MKAALVSATSLAALLAFEVGLDVAIDARPAKAADFTVSNQTLSFGNLGYVLLNTSGGTSASATETVTNATIARNTVTYPAVSGMFLPTSSGTSTLAAFGSTGTRAYTVTFTAGTTVGTTASLNTQLSAAGTGNTAVVTLTAEAVGPKAATVSNSTIYGRVGGGAQTIAAITVSNIGNGDLFSNTTAAAQLQGSIGAISGSVFTRSGSTTTFSLNDSHYTGSGAATTSATFNYVYTPTARGVSGPGSLTISYTNGNPSGTNTSTLATVTLTGQGVGPTYESNVRGSVFSSPSATGNTTVAAGTIATGAYKTGTTTSMVITLSNISTDPNGGNSSLTSLTLESDNITGTNASNFSIVGFSSTPLSEGGVIDVTLDFHGSTMGSYTADLAFGTDQGGPSGGVGAVFNYVLTANIPEPATMVTFGMGLAGLGWVRRRRATRRAVTGTHTLAI